MYDLGAGLVGPSQYDWLDPLCFLAAGHAARCDAFLTGYGAAPGGAWRPGLLRLLLLHRYSHLRLQIAHAGWDRAQDFDALAALIWP
jgi:hygromycin-B 7''-O-kinase